MFAKIKEWMASAPVAAFGPYRLYSNHEIEKLGGSDRGRQSLAGATVELDDGEEFSKRVTLPRFMLVGLFALAAKKKRGGEKFLLISGPERTWWTEVPRSQVPAAQKFAARVKAAAAEAGRVEPGGDG